MYAADTSFFMEWQARVYPLDCFPSLNDRILELVSTGELVSNSIVLEEIEAVGTPDLKKWARANKHLFIVLPPGVQTEGASIEAKYPDLMDPKGLYTSADAYVIAQAKLANGVVLNQETYAHEKTGKRAMKKYIPDVCSDLGVTQVNILGLIRRENWKF